MTVTMKTIIRVIVLVFLCAQAYSQHKITGTFPNLAHQKVKLEGFSGFETYLIAEGSTCAEGRFELEYYPENYGIGFLSAEDDKTYLVILSGEDIAIKGKSFAFAETIEITKGEENKIFVQYAKEHLRREQALSAWSYLEQIYTYDPLFANHDSPVQAIAHEKQRIRSEDSSFLAGINPKTYVSWYLSVRKLLSSVHAISKYRTEEIPKTIAALRNIDYADYRLYKSGLLRETIEAHFWLIENSGRSLDSVFIEMNISIDHLINILSTDEKMLNEITGYLFNLLERHNLFASSEYLALKVLNEVHCSINTDLAAQLESYRAMKIGNTAPDFTFSGDFFAPAYNTGQSPEKLSDLESKYTLVVFGASWCLNCTEELHQIARLYEKWKTHGMEVVFVSLDDNRDVFRSFVGGFPFISVCDYHNWESQVVKAWHVFATPTRYLLNNKREILLRPNSVQHMDAWVEWYLIQGN